MEVKNWDVKEQFLFPASFGVPKDIRTVAVTPQFEQQETEESIQIVGIYHITCHVEFEEGEHAHHATSEITEIEDLDVQGEVGYFEYAVPMSIDIPKEKIRAGSSPTLNVQHVNAKTTEHAAIEIAWSVNCEFEGPNEEAVEIEIEIEKKIELEPISEEKDVKEKNTEDTKENENTAREESELQFILDLADGYSKVSYPSNYVSVKQKTDEE
ncbi:hypothetical protein [Psychrobacillus lasiicapitis]|uniref:Stage VI sporulation protein D N-terminal domain-containing protein n=1 Tax=Psychrobacillus lasiicapitis TaxID=1636719 RepID=A0A544T8Q9_9BACI|nr:hypothetical protein [Psychrobacillus lasiicapitis]TQR13825.1 hypothetical protein FG382_09430 [Psychrobacillus lasiicapitis]GGA35731.1 hypothetical protein GCM10011384_26790 [Psychrobacillus lasiicapitis]